MYAWIDLLASESLKKLYMETLILILVLHHFRSNILNDHDSGRNYDTIFRRSPPNTITTADNHSYRSDCTGQHILTACGTCWCCCYHHCTQCCRCHSTNFPRFLFLFLCFSSSSQIVYLPRISAVAPSIQDRFEVCEWMW